MTLARSALVAAVALILLIGSRPAAGFYEQFPRGLMAAEPQKSKGCTIETRPLSFGVYDALSPTALDAVGQVIYTCGEKDDKGVKNIRIELSRGYTNSYSDRAMVGPSAENLFYNVYLDSNHRTIWGDGSNGTDYYFDPHPPNKTPVVVPAFGRIRPMQDIPAGQYTDVLQVEIKF